MGVGDARRRDAKSRAEQRRREQQGTWRSAAASARTGGHPPPTPLGFRDDAAPLHVALRGHLFLFFSRSSSFLYGRTRRTAGPTPPAATFPLSLLPLLHRFRAPERPKPSSLPSRSPLSRRPGQTLAAGVSHSPSCHHHGDALRAPPRRRRGRITRCRRPHQGILIYSADACTLLLLSL